MRYICAVTEGAEESLRGVSKTHIYLRLEMCNPTPGLQDVKFDFHRCSTRQKSMQGGEPLRKQVYG